MKLCDYHIKKVRNNIYNITLGLHQINLGNSNTIINKENKIFLTKNCNSK